MFLNENVADKGNVTTVKAETNCERKKLLISFHIHPLQRILPCVSISHLGQSAIAQVRHPASPVSRPVRSSNRSLAYRDTNAMQPGLRCVLQNRGDASVQYHTPVKSFVAFSLHEDSRVHPAERGM